VRWNRLHVRVREVYQDGGGRSRPTIAALSALIASSSKLSDGEWSWMARRAASEVIQGESSDRVIRGGNPSACRNSPAPRCGVADARALPRWRRMS